MIEFIVCLLFVIVLFFVWAFFAILKASKLQNKYYLRLIEENYIIPKEEECKVVKLHDIQWYLILHTLKDSKYYTLYQSLYYAFSDQEIEEINNTIIAQDLINKVNEGTEL